MVQQYIQKTNSPEWRYVHPMIWLHTPIKILYLAKLLQKSAVVDKSHTTDESEQTTEAEEHDGDYWCLVLFENANQEKRIINPAWIRLLDVKAEAPDLLT